MPDDVRFCDELDFAFGWIHPDPDWMQRAGHAVLAGGGVWLIDPIDGAGVDERVRALGEPAGVVQLLDRHDRDCKRIADELGVPLYEVPTYGVYAASFEAIPVLRTPFWKEVALWFPREQTLVCADLLAAAPGYTAPNEDLGVHPLLRLPLPRRVTDLPVEHLLLGHGPGLHGPDTTAAIERAFHVARRNLPLYAAGQSWRLVRSVIHR